MELQLERLSTLEKIDPAAWNGLAGDNPFLKHEFLIALEHSGSVGAGTAWQPLHLLISDAQRQPIGALPLYLKYDSRGEFVFDWSWADAYQRCGRSYYPKLVSSIPFTPATGERLLMSPGVDVDAISEQLIQGARSLTRELGASSLHILFPTEPQRSLFDREGFLMRKSCQFHWHNQGYSDFEDFLSRFSSAKRKKARRERRRVVEAEIVFEHLRGDQPTPAEWDAIFEFYARTFLRRGRPPYLNRAFFDEIATTMPENLLIVLARYRGTPIAAAICFRGGATLYGRYWGSLADFHSLHFEACYYQGIDYCIREGLQRFEPGTQGEHKISRGFTPHATWSCHWLSDPEFHEAIADYLARETLHVDAYMESLDDHVPYRRDGAGEPAQLGSPRIRR
ncbi:MAG TPA: GNAT family N-acetyltransferase [Gammaproteobacteria bacterium]|nr:GNAT family N-acetyltransferase [Gammaproteobacteria bacterium]